MRYRPENKQRIITVCMLSNLILVTLLANCGPSKDDIETARAQEERERARARTEEMVRLQSLLQGNPMEVQGSTLVVGLISKPLVGEAEKTAEVMSCWLVGEHFQENLFADVRFVAPNYDIGGMEFVASEKTPLPRRLLPPDCK